MNALAGTTNLPEKPAGYLTDSDRSQAVGDDGISSGESEVSGDQFIFDFLFVYFVGW